MTAPKAVLDIGCGTGENAIFYAQNGFPTTGVDYSSEAIAQAKTKAEKRGVKLDLMVGNALKLHLESNTFDYVTDSGLFHVFDDDQRLVFRDQIVRVLKPGGTYFMMCFSDKEPGGWGGPRRVSRKEIETVFSPKFQINYIRDELFTTNIHEKGGKAYLTSSTKPSHST